jgi:hypothetical protein
MTETTKGEDIMAYKTPLRLVAIEERPLPDEPEDAAPSLPISDEQAITRRVPESDLIAAHDTFREPPRRAPRWQRLLPAAAIGVVIIVGGVVLATRAQRATAPAPALAPQAPAPAPVPTPVAVPVAAAVPAAPPERAGGGAEFIRVEITAEPVEAELSLDGNVVAGHRLNLDVPRDRGIHVVSAAAPGYIPFNQQVSFSRDVVLTISLRRGHVPAPARPSAHARPTSSEVKPQPEVRAPSPPSAPAAAPRFEPGMNLEGPAARAHGKPIDERNPYQP